MMCRRDRCTTYRHTEATSLSPTCAGGTSCRFPVQSEGQTPNSTPHVHTARRYDQGSLLIISSLRMTCVSFTRPTTSHSTFLRGPEARAVSPYSPPQWVAAAGGQFLRSPHLHSGTPPLSGDKSSSRRLQPYRVRACCDCHSFRQTNLTST
ncbi:hypothetical protein J6590_022585 [Homalodisca vitripennis]|nr:hypothetical protein J6590_022585 [Homalodisca vitripennis]